MTAFSLLLAAAPLAAALEVRYATQFTVTPGDAGVVVTQECDGRPPLSYTVGAGGDFEPPVSRVVALETTFLGEFQLLGSAAVATLVGVQQPTLAASPLVRERLAQGEIADVANATDPSLPDASVIASLDPDVVLASPFSSDDLGAAAATLPVLVNCESFEGHPLGRLEWIKWLGLLLGRAEDAERVFGDIEADYYRAVGVGAAMGFRRPYVVSGRAFPEYDDGKVTFYVPGGGSYIAQLIKDASGEYAWSDATDESGSLELTSAEFLDRARDSEYWVFADYFVTDMGEFLSEVPEASEVPAASLCDNVFERDALQTPEGVSQFFEVGLSQPHIILYDLISIFHPRLLPDYKPVFLRHVPTSPFDAPTEACPFVDNPVEPEPVSCPRKASAGPAVAVTVSVAIVAALVGGAFGWRLNRRQGYEHVEMRG